MKRLFEEPSVEVVELKNIDVVTASSCGSAADDELEAVPVPGGN